MIAPVAIRTRRRGIDFAAISVSDPCQAALNYLRLGWQVVPMAPRGKSPNPELLPAAPDGHPSLPTLIANPATAADVRAWFQRDPSTNLGVLLGESSGGVAVLDINRPDDVPDLLLPQTLIVPTERGFHAWFRVPEGMRGRNYSFGSLRANRQVAVVPPSVHPNGRSYRWLNLQEEMTVHLPEIDSTLLAYLEARDRELKAGAPGGKRVAVAEISGLLQEGVGLL